MALISLLGQREPIVVADSTAKTIREQLSGGEANQNLPINIGAHTFFLRDIRVISLDSVDTKEAEKVVSMSTEQLKEFLGNWEKFRAELKTFSLTHDLKFYGTPAPLPDGEKSMIAINGRRVRNNLMGLQDAGTIQYLFESGAIKRQDNGNWIIADTEEYQNFLKKEQAMGELFYRRERAQKHEEEFIENYEQQKGEIISQKSF